MGLQIKQQEKIHQEVIESLKETNYFCGDLLDTLREERVKADYFMREKFTPKRGGEGVKLSEEIVRRVREI